MGASSGHRCRDTIERQAAPGEENDHDEPKPKKMRVDDSQLDDEGSSPAAQDVQDTQNTQDIQNAKNTQDTQIAKNTQDTQIAQNAKNAQDAQDNDTLAKSAQNVPVSKTALDDAFNVEFPEDFFPPEPQLPELTEANLAAATGVAAPFPSATESHASVDVSSDTLLSAGSPDLCEALQQFFDRRLATETWLNSTSMLPEPSWSRILLDRLPLHTTPTTLQVIIETGVSGHLAEDSLLNADSPARTQIRDTMKMLTRVLALAMGVGSHWVAADLLPDVAQRVAEPAGGGTEAAWLVSRDWAENSLVALERELEEVIMLEVRRIEVEREELGTFENWAHNLGLLGWEDDGVLSEVVSKTS